jgi:hypothetical protein
MEKPLPRDFKEFLKLCSDQQLEFMVVGGFAVSHHGYTRPTGDLDIWIAISRENAAKCVSVLKAFGFASSKPAPNLFLSPGQIIRMGVQPVRIEILNEISGVKFAACASRAVIADFDGVKAPVISRADLIRNKKAAGRPKDAQDVEQLTATPSKKKKSRTKRPS